MCAATTTPPEGKTLAEKVLKEAEDAYRRLPRKGKPEAGREWSVAAAFVAGCADGTGLHTVALATGNKCVGGSAARAAHGGDVVLDGHAEVLARRALRRLLLDDARRLRAGEDTGVLLEWADAEHTALRPRPDASTLHLVVSAPPCGDAAVYCCSSTNSNTSTTNSETKEETCNGEGDSHNKEEREEQGPETKRARTGAWEGFHVTGARRTTGEQRVSVWEEEDGAEGAVGACRAKPGRGDPTLSMSCSDKIAMWACTGVQGALAGLILASPLTLDTVVVCGGHGTPGDTLAAMQVAAERALINRVRAAVGTVLHTTVTVLPRSFEGVAERADTLRAAGAGIVWHAGGFHEVVLTHMGKKLGTTRAKFNAPANCSEVAKRHLFDLYLQTTGTFAHSDKDKDDDEQQQQQEQHRMTYAEAKRTNTAYFATKQRVKEQALTNWLPKLPSLDDFHL